MLRAQRCISPARDVRAAVHQVAKGLWCCCKQAVLDHPAIIVSESLESCTAWDQL